MTQSPWTSFVDKEPENAGEAILIVWNKGHERHLGVAWNGIENFRAEHSVGDDDKFLFWMYLPDPEFA